MPRFSGIVSKKSNTSTYPIITADFPQNFSLSEFQKLSLLIIQKLRMYIFFYRFSITTPPVFLQNKLHSTSLTSSHTGKFYWSSQYAYYSNFICSLKLCLAICHAYDSFYQTIDAILTHFRFHFLLFFIIPSTLRKRSRKRCTFFPYRACLNVTYAYKKECS